MGTRGHRREFSTLAFVILLAVSMACRADGERVLEIIALGHTLADEVIPSLQPLLEPGGTLTGMNAQLIVKTTPANLAEIKRALTVFDRAPRTLRITVKQDVAAASRIQADAVSGRLRAGDVRARLPDPGTHDGASVGIRDRHGNTVRYRSLNTRSQDDRSNAHFVTTLEGRPALIQTGQALPYLYQSAVAGAHGVFLGTGVDYIDVSSGFYVTPRLNGQQVSLEIAPQLERADPARRGAIDVRHAATSVSGRLGEWIALGGVDTDAHRNDTALLARTRRTDREIYQIWVKVDDVSR